MERELEELFSAETPPLSIADYDNLKPVMFELNTILAGTADYSLSFSTVDTSQTIVRRSIAMTFTTDSYESAKAVLRQLHDSSYRCMLDSVSISLNQGGRGINWLGEDWSDNGSVSVSGTIVYFEYQKEL